MVFGGRDPQVIDSTLHCFDLQRRRRVLIFGGFGSGGEHSNDTFLLRVWP
ncbi:hypothetical protein T492DRAFT_891193 [Pavlovales sp. CCMP2436]|nr:hypothetical protein T492DRAFT_891193 [Pavlovales sp. CCMP2436]